MDNNTNIIADSNRLIVFYWEQVLTSTFIFLIALMGVIGNSMIIIAVSFSCKLQTSTNAFVTSLAIADLITSIFLFFYAIAGLGRNGWPIPQAEWLCAFTAFVIYTCRGTSLYTSAAIGVNRLILITRPSLYRKIFVSWKLAVCLTIPWVVLSGSIIILLLTGFSAFGYDYADLACAIDDSNKNAEVVSLVATLIAFPIPLIVTTVSYSWIYVFLKKHFRAKKRSLCPPTSDGSNMTSVTSDTPSSSAPTGVTLISYTPSNAVLPVITTQEYAPSKSPSVVKSDSEITSLTRREQISQKQIEITKNLFVVVCSLYLCYLPYFILIFVPDSNHILFYARIITLANSTINFAIYAGKHPDFKFVFGHMMRRSYRDIPQPSRFLKFFLSQNK
ncbi:G-protein coupled receptor moody-like [Amphiura filiformis]|uniref:G-protein coupled receptor moody-like n=1 Tax=Amphiura filiformis TaxID=82378 RepID=UPI003B217C2F